MDRPQHWLFLQIQPDRDDFIFKQDSPPPHFHHEFQQYLNDTNLTPRDFYLLGNVSRHTALNVRLWCLYNCPQNLKTPPQSPDLNPIEHIWRELEVRVRKHDIKTKSKLKTVMMEEWMNIDAEITKKLVKSIPKRLKAVVDAKEYPTKY
ncbi:hypothetical protein AVEN_253442-1 [Araneus ventricosus]|uniref:Tc1-like transposase DDE domain-containing protein n=1 Tax=Araneus ventricosus TaxID=182803 RepID=A0A4Y2L077_ARAVE|nr:hypothetical protein AVEN_253442-1 [Araneus ventricosus]